MEFETKYIIGVKEMASELQKYNSRSNYPQWASQVEECRNSGMTVKKWCEENNVSISTYYQRQKRVYEAMQQVNEAPEGFYEVGAPVSLTQNRPVAALQYKEYRTEIYQGADEETITGILRAVKNAE